MESRVLFISGGTSGLGAATAVHASTRGFQVFVTGTSQHNLDRTVHAGGGRVAGVISDASVWPEVVAAVSAAIDRFGPLDVAWANAGLGADGDFQTGDVDRWRQMVLTNALGPALLLRAALPSLLSTHGQFLVTGSVLASRPSAGSLYAATKASAATLVESARQQLVGSGVRTSLVEIGRTDTAWWPDGARPPALSANDVAEAVLWLITRPTGVDASVLRIRPSGQVL